MTLDTGRVSRPLNKLVSCERVCFSSSADRQRGLDAEMYSSTAWLNVLGLAGRFRTVRGSSPRATAARTFATAARASFSVKEVEAPIVMSRLRPLVWMRRIQVAVPPRRRSLSPSPLSSTEEALRLASCCPTLCPTLPLHTAKNVLGQK